MFQKILTRSCGVLILAASTAVVVYSQLALYHLVPGFNYIFKLSPDWPLQSPQYVLQYSLTGYALLTVLGLGVGALMALPSRWLDWSPAPLRCCK